MAVCFCDPGHPFHHAGIGFVPPDDPEPLFRRHNPDEYRGSCLGRWHAAGRRYHGDFKTQDQQSSADQCHVPVAWTYLRIPGDPAFNRVSDFCTAYLYRGHFRRHIFGSFYRGHADHG